MVCELEEEDRRRTQRGVHQRRLIQEPEKQEEFLEASGRVSRAHLLHPSPDLSQDPNSSQQLLPPNDVCSTSFIHSGTQDGITEEETTKGLFMSWDRYEAKTALIPQSKPV